MLYAEILIFLLNLLSHLILHILTTKKHCMVKYQDSWCVDVCLLFTDRIQAAFAKNFSQKYLLLFCVAYGVYIADELSYKTAVCSSHIIVYFFDYSSYLACTIWL
jgi:hypothetical protein